MLELFNDFKNKKNWMVDNGRENEDRIERFLRESNLTKYTKNSLHKKELNILKKYIFDKKDNNLGGFRLSELIEEGFPQHYKNIFIREPFGSQSFPDFLIILDEYIIPIEVKKSEKSKKPMMNNSFFVKDSIYIYSRPEDVTFFKGEDITSDELFIAIDEYKKEARILNKKFEEKFKNIDLKNNIHGFNAYLRTNFSYKKFHKGTILDFFDKHLKKEREENVLDYIKSIY